MSKEFKFVDLEEYLKGLVAEGREEFQPFDAEKKDTARITARRGKEGEWIVSYTQDGTEEVRKQVGIDKKTGKEDMVVANANMDGTPVLNAHGQKNEWTIEDSVFTETYEVDPRNPAIFKPVQSPRKFVQVPDNIEFNAPASWGPNAGTMKITAGGFIRVDQAEGEKYGIAFEEFTQTHNAKDPAIEQRLHDVRDACNAVGSKVFESAIADDVLGDTPTSASAPETSERGDDIPENQSPTHTSDDRDEH